MKKIFYSWQSDAPREVNHDFIGDCVRQAAASIQHTSGQELTVQDGVRGEPGTPALADTILSRIAAADVYVADISLVYEVEGSDGTRLAPNPNVAIELGYATAALSRARVIAVQNTHFGKPEQLPFDLQHLNWPVRYALEPGASAEDIDARKSNLIGRLKRAIKLILADDRPRAVLLAKRAEVAAALANLVERNHTWQLALRRHDVGNVDLTRNGLAITEKIESWTDQCQNALVRTSAIDSLEQLRQKIVTTTLMIAGRPQHTEVLALDFAETNDLRDLIERLARSKERLDRLQQEQAEIDAESAKVEAEQSQSAADDAM